MDHGLWHDRVTGQHLYTQDQFDEEKRWSFREGYERRNEELALSRVQAAPEGYVLAPLKMTREMDEAGYATLPAKLRWVGYDVFRRYYEAAIAAAPSVNEQGGGK